MKKLKKRVISMFLVLALALSCNSMAYAAETTAATDAETRSVVGGGIVHQGYSSTSKISGNISVIGSTTLTAGLQVSGPCTIYVLIYNSSGTMIGATTFNFETGTYRSFKLTPSLSSGSYKVSWYFDRSDVFYVLTIS